MKIRSLSTHAMLLAAIAISGCKNTEVEPPKRVERPALPPKEVPEFLKGTILQYSDLINTEPMRVSGYGLVVNLSGTGDTFAPRNVLRYMRSEMEKHGFGNPNLNGYEKMNPDLVLNDPLKRTAIVRVDAYLPAGAKKNQPIDVQVSALENNNTTSLHRGILYSADMSQRGADPLSPGAASVNPQARASGQIVVNPVAALSENPTDAQKLSLKYGLIMGRGVCMVDRPMVIRLRAPEKRMARIIEQRIQERFQAATVVSTYQGSRVAAAHDDSDIYIYIPQNLEIDAEHFGALVTHLYLSPSNDFAMLKARELVQIAQKDREKAPLLDISYCWEGLGKSALQEIRVLYSNDSADVAYAAARAGAYLGDITAHEALMQMARNKDNPFQVNAVRVLGEVPRTSRISALLHELIDTDQNLLRIEAYKAMIATNDGSILSEPIQNKYVLDIVASKGPPLVYASRSGIPRIAVIGGKTQLKSQITFLSMGGKFSISSSPERRGLQLYYRGEETMPSVSMQSQSDLPILIARLGGKGPDQEGGRFDFSYGDIVGLLSQFTEQKLIVSPDYPTTEVAFQLQTFPGVEDPILSAKPIPESDDLQRPTTAPSADIPVTSAQDAQRPLN